VCLPYTISAIMMTLPGVCQTPDGGSGDAGDGGGRDGGDGGGSSSGGDSAPQDAATEGG
jgi:hypothetical protein